MMESGFTQVYLSNNSTSHAVGFTLIVSLKKKKKKLVGLFW